MQGSSPLSSYVSILSLYASGPMRVSLYMKRSTLAPRLNSSGKKPKSLPHYVRSNSAKPLPKIQPESPSVFLTGTFDPGEMPGLTDDEIVEMMMSQGAKTRSCQEMLAELDELEAVFKSEGAAVMNIQEQVAAMRAGLDTSASKTQELEGQVIGLLSEVREDDPDSDLETTEPPRPVTLPDIHRPATRDDGSLDTTTSPSPP